MKTTSPIVTELPQPPTVLDAARRFAQWPKLLVLGSARTGTARGRYSFLTADPFAWFEWSTVDYGGDPFEPLRAWAQRCESPTLDGLPPFQGGVAGLLGYELGRCWERFPAARFDEFAMPVLAVGVYDWVLAWDHHQGRCWLISHGWPEADAVSRTERARDRAAKVVEQLHAPPTSFADSNRSHHGETLARDQLAPQFRIPGTESLTSNFSRQDYLQAVQRVIEYIHAGDIFQANLAQRLLVPAKWSPLELYERLWQVNPAPFSGLLMTDDWAVISASPERFVQVQHGIVETRPIKGTRRRKNRPEADLFTRDELRESEKDQAENVMIVDLLRNDLSRVCQPGSIAVPQLCEVETFETVQHLVSVVHGRLDREKTTWDLLAAAFPGGSITGAPKVRAMEIIAELEPTVRGPYTGSLFYRGFDGACDSNLLIRTFTHRRGWLQCPVGGGIVADSDPSEEYAETLHKAAGMLRALE